MNNLLLWLAGILILALAALFIGPHFVDWNSYRAVFEAQATRLAGRKVTVEGNVNLRLLPAPYVSFERVRIGGDDKSGTPPLLEVEDYTLWLAVAPLLKGEIEARTMEIGRPKLRLVLRDDGTVNWTGLGSGDVDLPFVPRNVAFNATNIRRGMIEIAGVDGKTLFTIEDITGTLSARALTGPYKFIGEINSTAEPRELRWSTGRVDENGALRIKGTVKDIEAGTTYAADGLLQNLMTKPVFTGAIAGKLRKKGSTGFEMKTDVYADTTGARLSGITLLLDADNRPQIINGSGRAEWQPEGTANRASASIELHSRWLDIDRLIEGDTATDLLARIDAMQSFLAKALPEAVATTVTFGAGQVNFGGEALDDIQLKMTQRGAVIEIETLSASLPGASRLTISGKIAGFDGNDADEKPVFNGAVQLRGRTLSRFASWLGASFGKSATSVDGSFALEADVILSPDNIVLDKMRGRLRDTRFTGRLQRNRGEKDTLALVLKSTTVDLTRIFPDAASLGVAVRAWSSRKARETNEAGAFPSTNIKFDISRLKVGASSFADVVVDARFTGGSMGIARAAFVSSAGLSVQVEGDALAKAQPDEAAAQPQSLRFVVRVPTAAAYDELVQLAGVSAPDATVDRLSRALLPAHLAGSFGTDSGGAATKLRFDGTLAGNPAVGRIRIDGDDPDWRARTWDIASDMTLDDPARLFRQAGFTALAGSVAGGDEQAGNSAIPEAGRLVAYAIGTPRDGLKSSIGLRSKTVTLTFSGPIESTLDGIRLEGEISGQLNRGGGNGAGRVARVLGLDSRVPHDITFTARVAHDGSETALRDVSITAGAASLTGAVTMVDRNGKTAVIITAEADTLSLPGLLGLASGTDAPDGDASALWPDAPFDFSGLDGLEMAAKLRIGALTLGDGVTIRDATFDITGTKDRVAVSSLKGAVGGGTITADGSIERRPAGAEVVLEVSGANITIAGSGDEPEGLTAITASSAQSTFGFVLELKGLGLSPKGVISVMAGSGQIEAEAIVLPGFSPQVVQDVAADISEADREIKTADLKSRLASRLGDRSLDLGTQNIAFRIRDGAVQADDLRISTSAATITARTFIDIARMRVDSEWRIKPRASGGAPALPPVTIFFAGDVRNISKLSPGFGVAALERELAVRRLEGNIDRLEGLPSLGVNEKTKPDKASDAGDPGVTSGAVRPTIGAESQEKGTAPVSPRPVKRKRSTGNSLWQLNEETPPVELRLQTPEGANPT